MRAVSVQIWGSSALEGRHRAALEPLAQRSDALGGAHPTLARNKFRTNAVAGETASGERSVHRGLNTSGVCRAVTLRAGSVQIYGGGSRERRHGAALESLAQRSDALGGVGALQISPGAMLQVDAAKLIASETVPRCAGTHVKGD